MKKPLRIAVSGAAGRVGQLLVHQISVSSEVALAAAIVRDGDPRIGQWAIQGTTPHTPEVRFQSANGVVFSSVDVIIDFSSDAGTNQMLSIALQHSIPVVVATTGLRPDTETLLTNASLHIPILQAANTATGINALFPVVEQLAKVLPHFDAEIMEIHHRYKKDAPSGTAKVLAEKIMRARMPSTSSICYGREGEHAIRHPSEIGIHAVRGGDHTGAHTVFFLGNGEHIEITYRTSSRSMYAEGAIRAAQWLAGQKPGLYSMQDVLV